MEQLYVASEVCRNGSAGPADTGGTTETILQEQLGGIIRCHGEKLQVPDIENETANTFGLVADTRQLRQDHGRTVY